jgi:hypothetical protein
MKLMTDDDSVALLVQLQATEDKVILNSMKGDEWGQEVTFSVSPLEPKQKFHLIIRSDAYRHYVSLGDQHGEFRHRVPLNAITHYALDGFDIDDFQVYRSGFTHSSVSSA